MENTNCIYTKTASTHLVFKRMYRWVKTGVLQLTCYETYKSQLLHFQEPASHFSNTAIIKN